MVAATSHLDSAAQGVSQMRERIVDEYIKDQYLVFAAALLADVIYMGRDLANEEHTRRVKRAQELKRRELEALPLSELVELYRRVT